MQSVDLLLYPSISACSINDKAYAYIIDGKYFESKKSYQNFLETNVRTSNDFGLGPNVTEILQNIVIIDENETVHEISLSNDYRQNRGT